MLKTRVAHGYCSRQLAAEACPYANICEQCDNYVTAPEFIPQLQAQLADVTALRDDATVGVPVGPGAGQRPPAGVAAGGTGDRAAQRRGAGDR